MPATFSRWCVFLFVLPMSWGVCTAWAAADSRQMPDGPMVNEGEAILREADKRDSGFADNKVELEMILRNKAGGESRRQLRIKQIEVADDGDKLLVVFDTPKAVRGTALLSFSHKEAVDDQWLYLPVIKRVKKIASKNRSGPFLSSEFAFEDLSSQEVEKFTYAFVAEEPCPNNPLPKLITAEQDSREQQPPEQAPQPERPKGESAAAESWPNQPDSKNSCFVVDRFPVDEFSGYTKQRVWVDQQHYRVPKIDYFDRRGDLLKTALAAGFKQYEKKFWRPQNIVMQNHLTGKSTELIWRNYQFNQGLTENRDFTTNALLRVR